MDCPNCSRKIEGRWAYCPGCSFRLDQRFFDDIFSRMHKEMSELMGFSRMMDREFEALDLSPYFKKPRGTGFSIRIFQSGGKPPQVSVKTFGNVDKQQVEKAVYSQLRAGAQQGGQAGVKETQVEALRKRAQQIQREDAKRMARLKYTEEPQADVRRVDGKVTVDIQLPGVKSPGDIHIRELESSVEVKAIVGDKAFFKILTKPPENRLTGREFKGGVLHLEFG
ncbi:MAG: hypothetical protein HY367_00435 [Candidatus Aenigmarchaeota archaeon]|nr:hypothetical protein [Candidatus Aenigmarchaeota archaeon]